MSSGDIKGFYRQKKKGGVAKLSTSSSKRTKNNKGGAFVSAVNPAQTPALSTCGGALDLQEDYGDKEEVLRQFDMDMKYGPCIGVDRLERWERAAAMGLHPPPCVHELLVAPLTGNLQCLWEGRI